MPTGLVGTAGINLVVELSWNPSTDDSAGPISYRVFRNGTAIGTRTYATSYSDQPAVAATYRYKVRAIDTAGNRSAFSPVVHVAVFDTVDTTPPSSPQRLAGRTGVNGGAVLSWTASSDDRPGTLRYLVVRDGLPLASVTAAKFADQRAGQLAASYAYSVLAIDSAGNRSLPSEPVRVTVEPSLFPYAGKLFNNGDRGAAMVALTFDDCYNTGNVREIVRILRAYEVGATFFCNGAAVALDPLLYADLVTAFPLGNHTWDHPDLNKIAEDQILTQLTSTTSQIESATGWTAAALMRAPYGRANATVRSVIGTTGLPVIRWDIDTLDYQSTRTPAETYAAAIKAKNGSIVLMHDKARTVSALPDIIVTLKARGFRLVTIPELLGLPWQPAEP